MNKFESPASTEPEKNQTETVEHGIDLARIEENLQKYQIELPNLDQLVESGMGNLEVVSNGSPVKFDQLAVAFEESMNDEPATAEVIFIEKSNKEENQGIGVPLYVKLGQELAAKGIVLVSSATQYGPGRNIWLKLASLGYAEKTGPTLRFRNKTP